MNTLQKGFSFVFVAFTLLAVTVVLTPKAHADDFSGNCCSGGGFDSTFNSGYDSSYTPSYDSSYTPSYGSSYTPSYDSTYSPGYSSSYAPSYDSTYSPGYSSSYTPAYDSNYSQAPVYYGSDGTMYSDYGGGYGVGGGYGYGGGYPGVSFGSYPIGQATPIVTQPSIQHQTQGQSQTSTNTNSNTNVNNNTSSSNSTISNSGNSNNNINVNVTVPQQQAQVTPVYTLPTVQYPIQYVQPIQPTYQPAPYCTISISNTNGYNNYNGYNQATLTWSASNATTAYISNIGSVSTYGSRVVNPTGNQTYTMTVYGQNGQTATCQTYYTYTPTYVAPTTPYVSLSQIPYTGFDLGTVGNSIYWASLAVFALAAGYLMIYFRGGALALAGNVMGNRGYASEETTEEKIVTPTRHVSAEEEMTTSLNDFNLPVTSSRHVTTDTMNVTPDGRLVINRS